MSRQKNTILDQDKKTINKSMVPIHIKWKTKEKL